MPVRLDWEIDDKETPVSSPDLDPNRRRSRNRWLRWFVPVVLAIVIAVGFFLFRLGQKQNEIDDELRSVVTLELSALIGRDRDLFLDRQNPDDLSWLRAQQEAFDRYHSYTWSPWEEAPELLRYTGEITAARVEADKGWALVELARGERVWTELWTYRRNENGGWHRVRLDEEWLGEVRELVTTHLLITYHERDEPVVTALAHEIEEWYSILTPLFGITPNIGPEITIDFTYRQPTRPASMNTHWDRTTLTLEARSPHQGFLSKDGKLSLELRKEMAGFLVDALIAYRAGVHPTERLERNLKALRRELRDWALERLAAAAFLETDWIPTPTPLIDDLVARGGAQSIVALTASLYTAQNLEAVLTATSLGTPDTATRMAFHVAAINRAFYEIDDSGFLELLSPGTDRQWQIHHRSRLGRMRDSVEAGHLWHRPISLEILSVTLNQAIAWVETETMQTDGLTYQQTYFFREVGDDWLLTQPDLAYFGEPVELRMENLVFHYYTPDRRWFEGPLPTQLQAIYSQAANDLGIPIDGTVINVEAALEPWMGSSGNSAGTLLRFTSPVIEGWPIDSLDEKVMAIGIQLLGILFENRTQDAQSDDYRFTVAQIAGLLWEIERLFPGKIDWDTIFEIDMGRTPASSLTELWTRPDLGIEEESLGPGETELFEQSLADFRALFRYLAETYGPEAVGLLLNQMALTDDLETLLRSSTGQGVSDIEPQWQTWVAANFNE